MADTASLGQGPMTPDFDTYPVAHAIQQAKTDGQIVSLAWDDGRVSRFHAFFLRENEPGPETYNPETREVRLTPLQMPSAPVVESVAVDADGFLQVQFGANDVRGRFHPGWLRLNDYSNGGRRDEAAIEPVYWSSAEISVPPTFEGSDYLENRATQEDFLKAVVSHGFARLRNTPTDPMYVDGFASVIGPVRDNNFGRLWDVRVEPGPGSNAYTSLELAPHTDLCTREYQPGLQVLHCIWNSTVGGEATMVDGFRVAQDIRAEAPDLFHNLTTVNRTFTNRAETTDYRYLSPPIVLEPDGRLREIRVGGFLRGPTNLDFDAMEATWQADRAFYERLCDPKYMIQYRYEPGDLVIFDNRRLLHGRKAFDEASGKRWLRGCYIEREELHSAIRMLSRRAREAATATG